jgi:hypothetical protein
MLRGHSHVSKPLDFVTRCRLRLIVIAASVSAGLGFGATSWQNTWKENVGPDGIAWDRPFSFDDVVTAGLLDP